MSISIGSDSISGKAQSIVTLLSEVTAKVLMFLVELDVEGGKALQK